MTYRFAVALGATYAVLAVGMSAIAGEHSDHPSYYRQILPPVSGTIAMPRGSFGRGAYADRSWRRAETAGWRRRIAVDRGRGSGDVDGRQMRAYGQPVPGRYGYGYSYTAPARGEGWASGGTGLVGVIGDGGNPFAGAGTAWGTADSATTGGGYSRYGGDSVRVAYGEPDLWTNASYGAPPRLGYYSSGAPSTLPYYSSGSSAGPNGSPGGLAVYSSGAYGPGPKIVVIGRNIRTGAWRQGCTCGPHIIYLGHRHSHYARW